MLWISSCAILALLSDPKMTSAQANPAAQFQPVPRRRWGIAMLLGLGVLVNYFDRVNLSVSRDRNNSRARQGRGASLCPIGGEVLSGSAPLDLLVLASSWDRKAARVSHKMKSKASPRMGILMNLVLRNSHDAEGFMPRN